MSGWFRHNVPTVVAMLALLAAVGWLARKAAHSDTGAVVFALDDGYIHMAIAKNLVQHGVWGPSPHEFASAASSVAWPLLLAVLFKLLGPLESIPLILNVVFALWLLWAAHAALRRYGLPPALETALLLAVVFMAPLPTVIFTGMEHSLHILLSTVFVLAAVGMLAGESPQVTWGEMAKLGLLGALTVMARFEGLFAVAVVALLMLLRRRLIAAGLVGLCGGLPAAVFAAISVHYSAAPIPNSLLLKSHLVWPTNLNELVRLLGYDGYHKLAQVPHLVALIALGAGLVLFGLAQRPGRWGRGLWLMVAFVALTWLHMQFAAYGWFYRYEAYLVVLGLLAVGMVWWELQPTVGSCSRTGDRLPQVLAVIFVLIAAAAALTVRAVDAFQEVPGATRDIWRQQYQMGRFLREYYSGEPVAAHDIGAVTYLSGVRCLDLYGLGTTEVALAKKNGTYNTARIAQLVARSGARIFVGYDSIWDKYGGLPADWIRVGEWRISNLTVCYDARVVFCGLDRQAAQRLRSNLQKFASRLPPDVAVTLYPER